LQNLQTKKFTTKKITVSYKKKFVDEQSRVCIQGVLAIRGFVIRGFAIRGSLKPLKPQHFAQNPSILEMKNAHKWLFSPLKYLEFCLLALNNIK
jgi:hypothetical protein